MKSFLIIFFISVAIISTSCQDDSSKPIDLIGLWESEEVYVNEELQNVKLNIILSLESENTYYRNYESGTWSMKDGGLFLNSREDLGLKPWRYKIISSSDTTLILETTITEKEYPWNFESIAEDELITVTEQYRKIRQ